MNFLCRSLVRPWHRLAGQISNLVSFSVAEWLIGIGIGLGIWFLVTMIFFVCRQNWRALYRRGMSLLALVSLLFGLFSLWWGVFYYSDSFQMQSGLRAGPVSVEALEATTMRFAVLCNEYATQVQRDDAGITVMDDHSVFDRAETLYRPAAELYPCLDGTELRPKPVIFSRLMSYLRTTGFFFPYTAEANLNMDAPDYTIPSTVAHEQAHQRGVAREDEANFVAVLSCLENGDPEFVYSAAMMAYTYLGNALYGVDYDTWYAVYMSLDEPVRLDLRAGNQYWSQFETKVADMSETVYEGFLRTYGDDRGMKSYGACVDLLVAYYGPDGIDRIP